MTKFQKKMARIKKEQSEKKATPKLPWKILTQLHTVKIGKAFWMLTKDMMFATPGGRYIVPEGFLFDHASVPRIATSIVPPVKSAIAEASVLHDWFYVTNSKNVPRKFADECLKHLTLANGGSKMLANLAYAAVRIGGGGLYNKQAQHEKIESRAYPRYKNKTHDELIQKLIT